MAIGKLRRISRVPPLSRKKRQHAQLVVQGYHFFQTMAVIIATLLLFWQFDLWASLNARACLDATIFLCVCWVVRYRSVTADVALLLQPAFASTQQHIGNALTQVQSAAAIVTEKIPELMAPSTEQNEKKSEIQPATSQSVDTSPKATKSRRNKRSKKRGVRYIDFVPRPVSAGSDPLSHGNSLMAVSNTQPHVTVSAPVDSAPELTCDESDVPVIIYTTVTQEVIESTDPQKELPTPSIENSPELMAKSSESSHIPIPPPPPPPMFSMNSGNRRASRALFSPLLIQKPVFKNCPMTVIPRDCIIKEDLIEEEELEKSWFDKNEFMEKFGLAPLVVKTSAEMVDGRRDSGLGNDGDSSETSAIESPSLSKNSSTKNEKPRLLDERRSHTLDLTLKQARQSPVQLIESVLQLDPAVEPQIVDSLMKYIPAPQEKETVRRLSEGQLDNLSVPDQYFARTSLVDGFDKYLATLKIIHCFPELNHDTTNLVKQFSNEIKRVSDSKSLTVFIKYAQSVGSYMQRGRFSANQAHTLKINDLIRWADVRANNLTKIHPHENQPKESLLSFLVRCVAKKDPAALLFVEEFNQLNTVCGISDPLFSEQIRYMESSVTQLDDFIAFLQEKQRQREDFAEITTKVMQLADKCQEDLDSLQHLVGQVVAEYAKLLELMHEIECSDASDGVSVALAARLVAPDQFFTQIRSMIHLVKSS